VSNLEIWKDVVGYEGIYQVSNLGRIRSLDKIIKGRKFAGKIRRQKNCRKGYKAITLCSNQIHKTFRVHRLVAIAFIPNPYNKPEINHLNEQPADNRVENLAWSTRKENVNWGSRTAKQVKSFVEKKIPAFGNHPKPVLCFSKENVLVGEYRSAAYAGKITGIDHSHISKCCRGELKTSGGYIWKYKC